MAAKQTTEQVELEAVSEVAAAPAPPAEVAAAPAPPVEVAVVAPIALTWADYLDQVPAPVPGWVQNGLECAGDTQERRTAADWDKLVSTYPYRTTY